jgi:hypothetical protein
MKREALLRRLRTAEGDSPRLGLAKAIARLSVRKRGRKRACSAIIKVMDISDEEKRVAKKRNSSPRTPAGTNAPKRDRTEYVQVREFLEETIRLSPERPTHTNRQLLTECREKFGPGVTGRLFKVAKSAARATFSETADAWKLGDRPRKTGAPRKPAHPVAVF